MKRRDLNRYLESHGCELLREGGRHSWWHNPSLKTTFSYPSPSRDQRNPRPEDLQRPGRGAPAVTQNKRLDRTHGPSGRGSDQAWRYVLPHAVRVD